MVHPDQLSRWLREQLAVQLMAKEYSLTGAQHQAVALLREDSRRAVSDAMRELGMGHKEWGRWLVLARALQCCTTGERRLERVAERLGMDASVLRRHFRQVPGLPWSSVRELSMESVPGLLARRVASRLAGEILK